MVVGILLLLSNMCISPISIPNPYYKIGDKGLNYLHNTHDAYISVPCGSCVQCLSLRQSWFLQRVQMESLRSHLFFFTLTYNNDSLPYVNIGEYNLSYCDYSDIQNMFKRLRKKFKLRYWVVSERGTQSFRPHFHGLLAIEKSDNQVIANLESYLWKEVLFEWRRNISEDNFHPIYIPLCTYKRKFTRQGIKTNYDLHFVEPLPGHDNDVSFYVSKYILKYDDRLVKLLQKISLDINLDELQTKELISKLKPRSVMSKDFGSYKIPEVRDYILKCVSKDDMLPQFYDLNTGKSSLLSPYYRKHLLSIDWLRKKWLKYSEIFDSMLIDDDMSIYDYNSVANHNDRFVDKKNNIQISLKNRCLD